MWKTSTNEKPRNNQMTRNPMKRAGSRDQELRKTGKEEKNDEKTRREKKAKAIRRTPLVERVLSPKPENARLEICRRR